MYRLERITVQLVEAKRLATHRDDAHSRLALLLLDNVVELLLYREASHQLAWANQYGSSAVPLQHRKDIPEELAAWRDEVLEAIPSTTRRKKIEREFDAKAEYLTEKRLLEAAEARVLKKLHQYRNETYHREEIRQHVLETAVSLYFWLACKLLATLPVHGITYSHGVPKGLQPFISTSTPPDYLQLHS